MPLTHISFTAVSFMCVCVFVRRGRPASSVNFSDEIMRLLASERFRQPEFNTRVRFPLSLSRFIERGDSGERQLRACFRELHGDTARERRFLIITEMSRREGRVLSPDEGGNRSCGVYREEEVEAYGGLIDSL